MARDRWFTGYRAQQDRAAQARQDHLYRTDPAYRARFDAEVAAHQRRARTIARYGRLVKAAVERGELTHDEAIDKIMAAPDRVPVRRPKAGR